ncbi:DUF3883 domain-containing protein [Phaeodactylibacter sp.]|uniref:DUF3883 domain-containing protein n=1 Tax=Phaeodactylibacter sp. TaxID=1940289 RepID=UPI0025DC9A27|nr:DUF3883 domain-containing protein [Phaeodactylibacter sp.]MCI4648525.1 DUF3883 domain-containing protein [Phaeodactylibacter sp.]MCI5090127.1 DUF3883 domain-containing protein [Phaeodactylibacter sp.]
MSRNWSEYEVREIVKDYFDMLSKEIRRVPYKKSEHRKRLKRRLNGRSDGSVEYKHQNISAVLRALDMPFISGYKPMSNFQKILVQAVDEYLKSTEYWKEEFEYFTTASIGHPQQIDFAKWLEPIPQLIQAKEPKAEYVPRIAKVDYLAKEQANKLLGDRGEELVLQYEKWRLIKEDKAGLADSIEWISKEQGDGAGFDILSRNKNGTDRYIEVKTTKLGKYTPIYFSRNELRYSQKHESNYYLYRVFEFDKRPKMFNSRGSLDSICDVEPLSYLGRFG